MDDLINLKLPKVVLGGESELRKHDMQDYDSGCGTDVEQDGGAVEALKVPHLHCVALHYLSGTTSLVLFWRDTDRKVACLLEVTVIPIAG